MDIVRLLEVLKRILGGTATRREQALQQRRKDPQFVGRSSTKDIEQASPERVGELVGHAVERVET